VVNATPRPLYPRERDVVFAAHNVPFQFCAEDKKNIFAPVSQCCDIFSCLFTHSVDKKTSKRAFKLAVFFLGKCSLENVRKDLCGELNLVSRCYVKAVFAFIKFFSNTEFRLSQFSCVGFCKSVKPKFHVTERPLQSEEKNVPHEHWRGLHEVHCARMPHLLLYCVCNKRAYVVRRDIVHRIYQCVP